MQEYKLTSMYFEMTSLNKLMFPAVCNIYISILIVCAEYTDYWLYRLHTVYTCINTDYNNCTV